MIPDYTDALVFVLIGIAVVVMWVLLFFDFTVHMIPDRTDGILLILIIMVMLMILFGL